MSSIKDFQQIIGDASGSRRLGQVVEQKRNTAIIQDFLGRRFIVDIENSSEVRVGDGVITVNGVVIGTTEIETSPSVYSV